MSDELLPCPFCGSAARTGENGDNSPNWFVYCSDWKNCDVNQGGTRTEAEAIALWNRRAQAWPQGSVAAEQLAEALMLVEPNIDPSGKTDYYREYAAAVLARLADSAQSGEGVGDVTSREKG